MLESAAVRASGGGLQFEVKFGERAEVQDVDAVFRDFGERGEDVLDGGWVDVDAAHDDHVVGSAEDAALQDAFFGGSRCADEVAGAVAEDGPVGTAERGEDELTGFVGRRWQE